MSPIAMSEGATLANGDFATDSDSTKLRPNGDTEEATANGIAHTTRTEDLSALTNLISSSVKTYLTRLEAVGAPPPNLQDPFPEPVKDEAAQLAKFDILRACEKVMALVQGPVEWLMFQNMAFVDPACVGIAVELGIPEAVAPGPEPTSLEQLVEVTGASKDVLGK